MAISVLNTGTHAALSNSSANQIQWNLSPTPSVGNGLVIPWALTNCSSNSVPTPTISDNQGNTANWQTIVLSSNSSGFGGLGGLTTGIFFLPALLYTSGAFTVTIAATTGRQSALVNHVEIPGNCTSDKVGTYSSGATAVSSAAVTASGANAGASALVVGALTTFDHNNFITISDPPLSGYTSLGTGTFSCNAGNTAYAGMDIGYKVVSSLETSGASWTGWSDTALASASIATFQPPAANVTVNLSGQGASFTPGLMVASGGGSQPALALGVQHVPGPGISPDYLTMFRPRRLSTTFAPANITLALTGQGALFAQGAVGVNLGGNVTLPLTGSAILSTAGQLLAAMGSDLTLALFGQAATFRTGSLIATSGSNAVAQPSTSGSFNVNVWDTRHVIDRAYGALRIRPQQITPEMLQIALDLLGLTLQDLVNDAAPLWTLEKVLMTLTQGQSAYTLPTATNDVDKALFRTLNDVTPPLVLNTPVAYFFDFGTNPDGSDNATFVSSASITWASSAVPIIIQSSTDGISWRSVGKSGLTQLGSGLVWYDTDITAARRYWQIVPASAGTLAITSAALYNTPSDIEMSRLNKDDYWNLPNKAFQGRPLQFWLDRQLTPVMRLWPSPNLMAAENVMVVYRKRYIMDVGSLQQTVEVPSRWFMAIIFLLAEALSWTTPEADPTACELVRPKAAAMLRRAWLEERDRSPVKFNANISQYTK